MDASGLIVVPNENFGAWDVTAIVAVVLSVVAIAYIVTRPGTGWTVRFRRDAAGRWVVGKRGKHRRRSDDD